MHEDIFTIINSDKSEALLGVEPLHSAGALEGNLVEHERAADLGGSSDDRSSEHVNEFIDGVKTWISQEIGQRS